MSTPLPDRDAILRAVALLIEPGQVVELRALGVAVSGHSYRQTRSGYFNDPEALAKAAAYNSKSAEGVYVTLNPVNSDLLARAVNKMRGVGKGDPLTSDADVLRRAWLPVDVDPVRPAGISSTDTEKSAALEVAAAIQAFLAERDWPEAILADSGNGFHLLYRVNLPNDEESGRLIRDAVRALAKKFDTDSAKVDPKVFNAARLWKLYGTLARKGDSTPDRPHRRAEILRVPDQLFEVSSALLDLLVAECKAAPVPGSFPPKSKTAPDAGPIHQGLRHKTLVSLAGTMLRRGMGHIEIEVALLAVNSERCSPPLDEHRVRQIASDVVQRYGPGERQPAEDDSNQTPAPELDAPPEAEPEVEQFPVEVLPEPVRRLVEEGAKSLGCPPDLVAVPALVALGTAIGANRRIEVKPGWTESAAIYAAIVARPGGAKSPAQALALAPLHAAQERFHQEYLAARRDMQASDQAQGGAAPKGKPDKSAKPTRCKKAKSKGAVEADHARATCPDRQLVSTDSTTEALALVLRENSHGICYEQDELTALTGGFDRYRRGLGADRQFFQSVWSGQAIVINRVKQGKGGRQLDTIRVDDPFLCVVGGIQPDMLGELSDERGREEGFIHRFLFTFPEGVPSAYCPDGIDAAVRQDYGNLVDGLLCRLPVLPVPGAHSLGFTPEGREIWNSFMESHTAETSDPSLPDCLRGPWRKLSAYCARFALILQLARRVCGEAEHCQVDDLSVRQAVLLVRYFKSHARKVYEHLRNEPANERVPVLLEWIAERGGCVSLRDVLTAKVAGCRNAGDVMILFERLRRAGIGEIYTQRNTTGGRPSIRFSTLAPGGDR